MYHCATNICNGILHKRKSTVPNGKRYCEAFCELAVFLCNKFLNRKYIYVVILNGEKVLVFSLNSIFIVQLLCHRICIGIMFITNSLERIS